MNARRDDQSTILEILKTSPKGMNVLEISRAAGINRITAAKYLDMLAVSGQVELRKFGRSKLYYVSNRRPISKILDTAPDSLVIVDQTATIAEVNEMFARLSGIEPDATKGKKPEEITFFQAFRPPVVTRIAAALAGEETTLETVYLETGQRMTVRFVPLALDDGGKGAAISFAPGQRGLIFGNAATECGETYWQIWQHVSDGMFLLDSRAHIVDVNKSLEDILGVSRRILVGKPVWEIRPLGATENSSNLLRQGTNFKNAILALLSEPEAYPGRYEIERELTQIDGSIKTARIEISRIETAQGRILLGVIRDVSAQKQSIEVLTFCEEKLRRIMEQSGNGIIVLDRKFAITEVNEKALELLERAKAAAADKLEKQRLSRELVLNRSLGEVLDDQTEGLLKRSLLIVFLEGEPVVLEHALDAGGKLPYDVKVTPVTDRKGNVSCVICTIGERLKKQAGG